MTKLIMNDSPTAQLIAKAAAEVTVKDKAGRAFRLAKPGILAKLRIVEVMGAAADINTYRGMVTPLIFITAIDDEPVSQPVNKLQLEALMQRVGDDGLEAVVNGVVKYFGESNDEADKESIKK